MYKRFSLIGIVILFVFAFISVVHATQTVLDPNSGDGRKIYEGMRMTLASIYNMIEKCQPGFPLEYCRGAVDRSRNETGKLNNVAKDIERASVVSGYALAEYAYNMSVEVCRQFYGFTLVGGGLDAVRVKDLATKLDRMNDLLYFIQQESTPELSTTYRCNINHGF